MAQPPALEGQGLLRWPMSWLCMHRGALCSGCTQGHQSGVEFPAEMKCPRAWDAQVLPVPGKHGVPGERPALVGALACAEVLSVGVSCSVPC